MALSCLLSVVSAQISCCTWDLSIIQLSEQCRSSRGCRLWRFCFLHSPRRRSWLGGWRCAFQSKCRTSRDLVCLKASVRSTVYWCFRGSLRQIASRYQFSWNQGIDSALCLSLASQSCRIFSQSIRNTYLLSIFFSPGSEPANCPIFSRIFSRSLGLNSYGPLFFFVVFFQPFPDSRATKPKFGLLENVLLIYFVCYPNLGLLGFSSSRTLVIRTGKMFGKFFSGFCLDASITNYVASISWLKDSARSGFSFNSCFSEALCFSMSG